MADDKLRIMNAIDEFKVDPEACTPPGEAYQTNSGAVFTVDETGKVTFVKSTGCMGCDLCWPVLMLDGKAAHHVNPTDVIYCTKPTAKSTRTLQ